MSYYSKQTITRPANVTPYTANDVVGNATTGVLTFTTMGRVGGQDIIITDVDFRVDLASVPASMSTFRLHLYDVTPPSALLDNAPWDLPAGDRDAYLGYVDITIPIDIGSTLHVQVTNMYKKIRVASSGSLFGYLVTAGGYTPTSGEVYSLRVHAIPSAR